MAVTATQFIQNLEASGLVEAEFLSAVRSVASKSRLDGRALAAHLVKEQQLSAYQAKQLLAGNTRGFFIEKYKILEPIGRGGMGLVFKAEHVLLGRVAAIKVLPRKAAADREAIARFRREACATAQLEHENIVRVYDFGQQGEAHFIAMEYVAGQNLSRTIKARGRLAAPEAVSIIYQVALGLEHAYRRGITHRDIKPSNVLVTPEGKAKILDMGLARVFGLTAEENAGQLSLTISGTVVGTVDYVAPEQADDSHRADVRSDIYSLGCTLYECLTGSVPFPGGTMMQKLMKHYRAQPTAITEFVPDVPEGLVKTVNRMMAKRPDDRFQSPDEVAQALFPFLVPTSAVPLVEPSVLVPSAEQPPASAQFAITPSGANLVAMNGDAASVEASRPTLPTIPLGTPGPVGKLGFEEPVGSEKEPEGTAAAASREAAALRETSLANSDTHDERRIALSKPTEDRAPSKQPSKPPISSTPRPVQPVVKRMTAPPPPAAKPKADGAKAKEEPDINDVLEAIAAAANESLPSAAVVSWQREPSNRTRKVWIGCAIAAAVIAGVVLYSTTRKGVLVLQCPEAYSSELVSQDVQERGRVLLDGEPMAIPKQVAAEIPVQAGRHKLVVELPGLMPLNKEFSIAGGTRLLIELPATAQKHRQWELRESEPRVAAVANKDPNDAEVRRLRQQLSDFAMKHRGTDEVADALGLRSRLPFPADLLPTVKSPEDLIATSTGGDATRSPIAVVAMLGAAPADPSSAADSLTFSADGRWLARGCKNGKVELWDLTGGQSFRTLGNHAGGVMLAAFTPDGATLVSVSNDKIKRWDTVSGAHRSEIEGIKDQITCAAQSLDGRTLACAFREGQVAIYDMESSRERKQLRGFSPPILSLALTSDGEALAIGGTERVEIWNIRGAQRAVSLGASQEVLALGFSPDNKLLSTGGRAGTARMWKVETRQTIDALQKNRDSLAFGPDGKTAAVVTHGRKIEWISTQSGDVRRTLEFKETVGSIRYVAFTPDGRHVATAHSDGVVYLLRLL